LRFTSTKIPEVVIIEPQLFGDERGFFMETWQRDKFAKNGIDVDFLQDNHSRSVQGTLRGMHYQIQHPQGKLVRVTVGEVFDVAVDLRKSSSTFGMWVGEFLSSDNRKMLWVPPGFAHGFYVTSEHAEFLYKCSDIYAPEHERSIIWNDPDIAIEWPLVKGREPLLSEKDLRGMPLNAAELYD
jgi:dTDP-4-dehydrorhamnose 3,5-epimerase